MSTITVSLFNFTAVCCPLCDIQLFFSQSCASMDEAGKERTVVGQEGQSYLLRHMFCTELWVTELVKCVGGQIVVGNKHKQTRI